MRTVEEADVSGRVEFSGKSGATYSFFPLDQQAPLRAVGVTYVIAHLNADGWRMLSAGHTNNLAERSWANELSSARASEPNAEIFVRLNISRAIREAEAADLLPAISSPSADASTEPSRAS